MADFTSTLLPLGPSGMDILDQCRKSSTLDVTRLSIHLLGSEFLERQKRVLDILQSHDYFDKRNQLNLSRPDRYQVGLARAKLLRRLAKQHNWDEEDSKMADYLIDETSPFALHSSMFITTLKEQCSEDQMSYWLHRAEKYEIIGCYGQTELGHGSNVRGIECQAVWDGTTKEFVIHSPTLTASKWWNGTLGRTANHAVVIAQLILPDRPGSTTFKSRGPHPFIFQIRDMKTHQPLPGVVIGDIGPKFGYASMDNGYMLFNKFRVPHSALLARHSSVHPTTGEYIESLHPRSVYASLTTYRAVIIGHSRLVLARAVTIAVRYTSIRRQFRDRDTPQTDFEQAVISYPTVQIRIFPLLASVFALHYMGQTMSELFQTTRDSIAGQKDFSQLAEMHAVSSGLKSLCTTIAADGIETCRRSLGGHGFGGGSGMVILNSEYLSKPTVEGDNYMITQQTAGYLIRMMASAIEKPSNSPASAIDVQYRTFLKAKQVSNAPSFDIFNTPLDLVNAFQHRASHQACKVYHARLVQKSKWTDLMVQLHSLSRAHCEYLMVNSFYIAVYEKTSTLDAPATAVLKALFRLFALNTMAVSGAQFLISGTLDVTQLGRLETEIQGLMSYIKPHAVRLVDSWQIPDYLLASSLGRYDGDVYNDLFRKAHKENPLNSLTFNPDWKTSEIVLGEGEDAARRRITKLVLGYEENRASKL